MENTITLNSGQKIEVLLQDEVRLDIDCALRYIKSGEQEINSYVKNTAQPHLDNVITQAQAAMENQIAAGIENAAKAATVAAAQEISNAEEEIVSYTQQQILPALNSILGEAENAASTAAAKAQNATDEAAAASGSVVAARTKAEEASASADLAESWAIQAKDTAQKMSNGLNLFDIKWSDHLLESHSWLRADTFSWQSGTVYATAYNELQGEYNHEDSVEETENGITFKRTPKGYKIAASGQEEAIISVYAETGIGWYYILDTENQQFKLPRTKWGITGLRNEVGNYVEESLPNITGTGVWSLMGQGGGGTGAIGSLSTYTATNVGGQVYYGNTGFTFNASKSSPVYQDNASVQQRATEMYLYFYVGNYDKPAVEQTAGINSELFNNKADIGLGNISQTGKNKAISWGIPDYSAGISVSSYDLTSGYTAPCKGVLMGGVNPNGEVTITVNGKVVWYAYEYITPVYIPVNTNDVVKIGAVDGEKNNAVFYPFKGAN